MKALDWDHLRIVLAIFRGGSLTAAAHILGVDQTTVGRRLSAIETQLEGTLFVRSKAGFQATDAGQEVVQTALDIERSLDRLSDRIADTGPGAGGLLRVMANPWMLQRISSTTLKGFLRSNPALELRLSGRLPPVPLHGETTIGIWFDAAARAPDIAVPFARVPYAAYRSTALEDDCQDWVIFQDDDATGPSFMRRVAKRLGDRARVQVTGTDASILLAAARAGIGKAILPCCIGDRAKDLERVDTFKPIERVMHVHVNPDAVEIRRVRIFLDWLHGTVVPSLDATPLKNPLQ